MHGYVQFTADFPTHKTRNTTQKVKLPSAYHGSTEKCINCASPFSIILSCGLVGFGSRAVAAPARAKRRSRPANTTDAITDY